MLQVITGVLKHVNLSIARVEFTNTSKQSSPIELPALALLKCARVAGL